jgi:hypothetical protein
VKFERVGLRPAGVKGRVALGEEVDLLVRRSYPTAVACVLLRQVGAIDQHIYLLEETAPVLAIAFLKGAKSVAGKNKDREVVLPDKGAKPGQRSSLQKGFPSKTGNAFDLVLLPGVKNGRQQLPRRKKLPWPEGDHLGVAATRTAQQTPLYPEGKTPPRPLRRGTGNPCGQVEKRGRWIQGALLETRALQRRA